MLRSLAAKKGKDKNDGVNDGVIDGVNDGVIDKTNQLALIEKNGEKFMTGGFLINNTPEIRAVFDAMPREKHYEFAQSFKCDPFVKMYYYNSQEEKDFQNYESNRRVQA